MDNNHKIPASLLTHFTMCDLGTYLENNHTPKTYTLGADASVLLDWLTEHGWRYTTEITTTPEYGSWAWAYVYHVMYNCTPAGPFVHRESPRLTWAAENLLCQIEQYLPPIKGWDGYYFKNDT